MSDKEQETAGQQPEDATAAEVAREPAAGSGEDAAESDPPGAEEAPREEAEEETPEAAVERLAGEVEEARDQALRAQAELQNTRRRAEQEVERARKYALERFCGELLPIVDNLERALDAADREDERVRPIAEGVELTLKNFFDVLGKFHIEPVDPHGEPFDPQLHQAMSSVENAEAEPNTVIAVMQKGYTLNGRLVRPAMVMVSKAPSGDSG